MESSEGIGINDIIIGSTISDNKADSIRPDVVGVEVIGAADV